jgi:hypothetical protein
VLDATADVLDDAVTTGLIAGGLIDLLGSLGQD